MAALSAGPDALAGESADLLYHLLVLWQDRGIAPAQTCGARSRPASAFRASPRRRAARAADGGTRWPMIRNNVFARILRGEMPCKKVYEDGQCPRLPRHQAAGAGACAGDPERRLCLARGFLGQGAGRRAGRRFSPRSGRSRAPLGLVESGYRILANHGPNSHQEVPHFHVHIFGGRNLGRLLEPQSRARDEFLNRPGLASSPYRRPERGMAIDGAAWRRAHGRAAASRLCRGRGRLVLGDGCGSALHAHVARARTCRKATRARISSAAASTRCTGSASPATTGSRSWQLLDARLPFRDVRLVCRGTDGAYLHLSLSGLPLFDEAAPSPAIAASAAT